jgi:hypothetical protein
MLLKMNLSMAHTSTSPRSMIVFSFFISPLLLGIRMGDYGPGFPEAKSRWEKHPLALPHP